MRIYVTNDGHRCKSILSVSCTPTHIFKILESKTTEQGILILTLIDIEWKILFYIYYLTRIGTNLRLGKNT